MDEGFPLTSAQRSWRMAARRSSSFRFPCSLGLGFAGLEHADEGGQLDL
jgi:hypothetical protein